MNGYDDNEMIRYEPRNQGNIAVETPEIPIEETEEIEDKRDIYDKYLSMINIAEFIVDAEGKIDENKLNEIGERVCREYRIDKESRSEWEKINEDGLEMARMVKKQKNIPWSNASNVKYPLIAQAIVQFNARTYPNIIQEGNIVKTKVVGLDIDGAKADQAERIRVHMNYQLLEQMDNWEQDNDILLTILPLSGIVFKKTYYDPTVQKNVSEMITVDNVVVNYKCKANKYPNRITHIFELYPNEIQECKNDGRFLDIDLNLTPNQTDEDEPVTFYEQHRFLDLDNDGYKEPYIVTVHTDTEKVVRIVARWDYDGIKKDNNDKLLKIIPVEYFTPFRFMQSADGSYYGTGYGSLLCSINESINTSCNQMFDAGTNQNTGGGFISSRLQLTRGMIGGKVQFEPGEYKIVGDTGDDIRKFIVDRPVPRPSTVTMNMLKLLIETGERFGSVTDVLTGQQTMSNVPATTTLAMIEQGLKVFSAVYKRIYLSLKVEFKKLFRLNSLYLSAYDYFTVLDETKAIARKDYDMSSCDIIPACDPNNINDAMKKFKAEAMMQMSGRPGMNVEEINKYYMEAMQIPDIKRFIQPIQPQVDPNIEIEKEKVKIEMMKVKIEGEKLELDKLKTNAEIGKIKEEMTRLRADAIRLIAEAESKEQGEQLNQYEQTVQGLNEKINLMTELLEKQTKIINQSMPEEQKQEGETLKEGEPNVTTQPSNNISNEGGLGLMEEQPNNIGILQGSQGITGSNELLNP